MLASCPICGSYADRVTPAGAQDMLEYSCPECGNFWVSRAAEQAELLQKAVRNRPDAREHFQQAIAGNDPDELLVFHAGNITTLAQGSFEGV